MIRSLARVRCSPRAWAQNELVVAQTPGSVLLRWSGTIGNDKATAGDGASPPSISPLAQRENLRRIAQRSHAHFLVSKEEVDLSDALEKAHTYTGLLPSDMQVNAALSRRKAPSNEKEALEEVQRARERFGVKPGPKIIAGMASRMCSVGNVQEAAGFLMRAEDLFGVKASRETLSLLVRAFSSRLKHLRALKLLDSMVEKDITPQSDLVAYVLLNMAKLGQVRRAREVMEGMEKRFGCKPCGACIVAILKGYQIVKNPVDALQLLEAAKEKYGVSPTIKHLFLVMRAHTLSGQARAAEDLALSAVERFGVTADARCLEVVVTAFGAVNQMQNVERVVQVFLERKLVRENSAKSILINAYLRFGDEKKAMELMKSTDIDPPVYFTLVQRAAATKDIKEVERLFAVMDKQRIRPSLSCWLWRIDAAHATRGKEGLSEVIEIMNAAGVQRSFQAVKKIAELKRGIMKKGKRLNRLTQSQLKDRTLTLWGDRTDEEDRFDGSKDFMGIGVPEYEPTVLE